MRKLYPSAVAVAALALALACGSAEEPGPPQPGPRTENATLGIALATVPGGMEVAVNEGGELVLERLGEKTGTMAFEVGTVERAGVNLVDAVNAHKAEIEARPGGEYAGQLELAGPLGRAYSSRGRWSGDGGVIMEETALLAIHPWGDRLLTLRYVYPAGDREEVAERRDDVMVVLGEVQAAGTGVTEEPAP